MPTYGNITAAFEGLFTITLYAADYALPNPSAPGLAANRIAFTTDRAVASTFVALSTGAAPRTIFGMQSRLLENNAYAEANFGTTVTGATPLSVPSYGNLANWGGMYGAGLVSWSGGNVYTKAGSITWPSTTAAPTLDGIADVLGFPSITQDFSPQPVRWQGTDYLIMFGRAPIDTEPRTLLADSSGTLAWDTIWSGGDPLEAARYPLWFPDQGTGFNYVFQDGLVNAGRPSVVKVPSAGLGTETYNYVTLDSPTYDAWWLTADGDVASRATRHDGWMWGTEHTAFIWLRPDGTTYRVYQLVAGDATADAMLTGGDMSGGRAGLVEDENGRWWFLNQGENDTTLLASAPPPIPPLAKSLRRWRGAIGLNWMGLALVGDAFSALVGASDFDVFTEYDQPMRMVITSPPLQSNRHRIFVDRFELLMETGQGMPEDTPGTPRIMLDVSKDGGQTWGPLQKARSMGSVGEYEKRLRWLRLGQGRLWTFRLTITDPVSRKILGTYVDSTEGLS